LFSPPNTSLSPGFLHSVKRRALYAEISALRLLSLFFVACKPIAVGVPAPAKKSLLMLTSPPLYTV